MRQQVQWLRSRQTIVFSLLFLFTWFVHIYLLLPSEPLHHPGGATRATTSFLAALHEVAPHDRVVVLSYVDCLALETTENFYESSLRRHGIDNVMFVTSDSGCGDAMTAHHLPCHVYDRNDMGDSVNVQSDHVHEMFHLITTALRAGYTILYTDVDAVFFENPFSHINCTDCDVAVLADLDLGFMYVHPTPRSMELFIFISQVTLKVTQNRQDISREIYDIIKGFKVTWLPRESFQGGHVYFELGLRTYYGQYPCMKCIVVQNNGLHSIPAKIYRLKENMMWTKDTEAYYSSHSRKYLLYGNPNVGGVNDTKRLEKLALESALAIGKVLNRIVILPRFYCAYTNTHCSLMSLYNVTVFDAAFRGMYREHVFLGNEKVPEAIRESQTQDYIIATALNDRALGPIAKTLPQTRLVPKNIYKGATSKEIRQWLGHVEASVLCFKSLYSAFYRFTDPDVDAEFKERLKWGIQVAGYHQ